MKLSKKKSIHEKFMKPCGEASPYWNWVQRKGFYNEEGELLESAEANPDILSEEQHLYAPRKVDGNKAGALAAAWDSFSDKEKRVAELLSNGKSIEDVARVMLISRESVKTYVLRIKRKVQKIYKSLCHQSG